ncbi:DUF5667 domain-containing protein [Haloechinothrix sp. LS1_15]|uniref:DUF5667 domain-containing protein n=1 Tax=Haloechinothrix sp. LS1_15 TaxID=2652248 RepID=UPI0029488E2B|nr:DUF5667 domain-containing protein [Haloechinothrix sp. LS1_15]MDV6012627.1 hypothetical protein [Haloechinothrix sp. LS1_15]
MNQPAWYRRNPDRSERFARVVETGRDVADRHEFATELHVVDELRAVAHREGPDEQERERIRARLLAGDTTAGTALPGSKTNQARRSPRRSRTDRIGSLVAAAVATLVGLGVLGIELSGDALPDEFLYDVKRTTETLSLGAAFSDNARGFKHMELAGTRVAELEVLAERRDRSGQDGIDPDVYRDVLDNLDGNATSAARLVTTTATGDTGDDLVTLRSWAAEHGERMTEIADTIPGEARGDFEASTRLLATIDERAEALTERMTCYRITTGNVDEFGAVPATGPCQPPRAAPQPRPGQGTDRDGRTGSDAAGGDEDGQPAGGDPASPRTGSADTRGGDGDVGGAGDDAGAPPAGQPDPDLPGAPEPPDVGVETPAELPTAPDAPTATPDQELGGVG